MKRWIALLIMLAGAAQAVVYPIPATVLTVTQAVTVVGVDIPSFDSMPQKQRADGSFNWMLLQPVRYITANPSDMVQLGTNGVLYVVARKAALVNAGSVEGVVWTNASGDSMMRCVERALVVKCVDRFLAGAALTNWVNGVLQELRK